MTSSGQHLMIEDFLTLPQSLLTMTVPARLELASLEARLGEVHLARLGTRDRDTHKRR